MDRTDNLKGFDAGWGRSPNVLGDALPVTANVVGSAIRVKCQLRTYNEHYLGQLLIYQGFFGPRAAAQAARFSTRSSCTGSCPTSRSIGQPLALDACHRFGCAGFIVHAQLDPVVVPEVELGKVAVQVLF